MSAPDAPLRTRLAPSPALTAAPLTLRQQSWLLPAAVMASSPARCLSVPSYYSPLSRNITTAAAAATAAGMSSPNLFRAGMQRRFNHTPVSVIPPASSVSGSASSSTVASSAKKAALRGLAAVRARPLAHLSAFVLVHVTIAWAAIPPMYAFFRNTNTANALLAGPSVSYLLAKPLPTWIPTNLRDESGGGGGKGAKEPTVEDLLELKVRQFVAVVWRGGRGVFSTVNGWRSAAASASSSSSSSDGDASSSGDDAPTSMAKSALRFLRGQVANARGGGGDKVDENATIADLASADMEQGGKKEGMIKGFFGNRARQTAGDIKLGQIRDAVAAYVVVKTLLPIRVPLSAYLTPKVVRLFGRLARRGA